MRYKILIKYLLLLGIISFVSCTTVTGVLKGESGTGVLEYTSEDNKGTLFINGQKIPPNKSNSVELPVGSHQLTVFLDGYKSIVKDIEIVDKEVTYFDYDLKKLPSSGALNITTSPSNAQVLLNGLAIGKTPLQLSSVEVGEHSLYITKGNRGHISQKIMINEGQDNNFDFTLESNGNIMLEEFSNTNCLPCKGVAETLYSVVKKYKSSPFVSVVEYHSDTPSPQDPFYIASKDDCDYIKKTFSITSSPRFFVQGKEIRWKGLDNLEEQLKNFISEELTSQSSPDITISFDNLWQTNGTVRIENGDEKLSDVTVRVLLIEKEVVYSESPGTNGVKDFHNIFRGIYRPDGKEIKTSIRSNDEKSFNFTFENNFSQLKNLKVIAYIIDKDNNILASTNSNLVYQGDK